MSFTELVRNETIGFQQEIARLQALLEASRRVHGALDLDQVLHCVLELTVKELEADGAFFTDGEAIAAARITSYGRVLPRESQEDWSAYPNVPLFDKRGRLLTRLVVLRPGNPLNLEEQDFLEGLGVQSACGGHSRILMIMSGLPVRQIHCLQSGSPGLAFMSGCRKEKHPFVGSPGLFCKRPTCCMPTGQRS
jgi:hypothetical protein